MGRAETLLKVKNVIVIVIIIIIIIILIVNIIIIIYTNKFMLFLFS